MLRAASGKALRFTLEAGMVFEGQSLHALPTVNRGYWRADCAESAVGLVHLLTVTRGYNQQRNYKEPLALCLLQQGLGLLVVFW